MSKRRTTTEPDRGRTFCANVLVAVLLLGCATLVHAEDEVLNRALVPSADKPQGEVRLVSRGGGTVVQTLLYSKLLKRAVGKIVEKEKQSWPESKTGHEDSVRYTEALAAAREEIAAAFAERQDRAERRQALLIEFVLIDETASLVLAEPQVAIKGSDWQVVARRDLQVLHLSPAYVRANMRLITEDALGFDSQQAERAVP